MLREYKKFKQRIISINWDISWREENKILSKLKSSREKSPFNSVYDSVFQYKAQTYFLKFWQKIFIWIVSFFGFFYLIISNYSLLNKRKKYLEKYNVAYFYSYKIFAQHLRKEKKMVLIDVKSGLLLLSDLKFLFSILIKINFNFSLLSIATFRIAQVRYALNRYSVDEIWCNMEYSAASGILHQYCSKHQVKLVNFMHGEKVLTLRDSFCSFDTIYVWDEHYKSLFEKMACSGKIVISNPWLEEGKSEKINKRSICYILKGIESDDEIVNINKYLLGLEQIGFNIKVKEHPRNKEMSHKIQGFQRVKNVEDIADIFNQFEYILGQYSTVLTQAWSCNYKIIVDDITNPKLFRALIDRGYIFSTEKDRMTYLSDFIKST